jgi:uncharacterized protein YbjT (DUF2867 family)
VAESLLAKKQRVRVIVRARQKADAWLAKGAEVAMASLDDSPAVAETLVGAAGAYLLIPPNDKASAYLEDRGKITEALAQAVEKSKVPHVVLLSSIGAHLASGTGPIRALHDAERRLGTIAKSVTIVRAPYFMENWMAGLGTARTQGLLPSFLSPDRKFPMIATRDIGHIAAECLLDRAKGKRVLELSGPNDYSPDEVAAAVGWYLRHGVRVQHVPLSTAGPILISLGFSDDVARLLEEMYAGIDHGRIRYEGNGAAHARGLVALSDAVSEYLSREHTNASLSAAG